MSSHHNHNFYFNHDHEGIMVVMMIMMTIILMMLPYKVILILTQQRKRVHDPFHPKSRAMTRSKKIIVSIKLYCNFIIIGLVGLHHVDLHGYPAYSHHDKIPPWWGNVSNNEGGDVSVSKTHHTPDTTMNYILEYICIR